MTKMSDRDHTREELTKKEKTLLLQLQQAVAELQVNISKTLRYGLDDCPPERASVIPINGVALAMDFGKVVITGQALVACGLIEQRFIGAGIKHAAMRLPIYNPELLS